MLADLRQLISAADRLRSDVAKIRSKQVDRASVRDAGKAFVDTYFREVRPALRSAAAEALDTVDKMMQDLLSLTHHRSAATSYKSTIRGLRRALEELEKTALILGDSQHSTPEPIDLRILGVLKPMLPSAALSYEQALTDLSQNQRFSWRGPATDLREALRETLDHLAPDGDVTAVTGFKLEPGMTAPTMKQKVRFLLKKRGMS